MRFASLGSGSRGNATLISHQQTSLLVDCGFSVRETERRLSRLGVTASELTAIVVTHEHQDHVQGVAPLARKYQIPVYMTRGVRQVLDWGKLSSCVLIEPEMEFSVADIRCNPFTVPHDSVEPVQFVFDDGHRRLGLLTDTGSITSHIVEQLQCVDSLLLECNHDSQMLENSDYPASLKQRVGGKFGHLNNQQAAELLTRIDTAGLKHLVAMHLSQQNNTPELAQQSLATVLGCTPQEIAVADQQQGLDWRMI